jgi:2-iminobutanoate/2-iminopropanoate deaminase
VTEKKEAMQRLADSEQNFRNVMQHSPMGMWILNKSSEVLYSNPAAVKMTGYASAEEWNAVPFEERYTPESLQTIESHISLIKQGQKVPPDYYLDQIRKDGTVCNTHVYRAEVIWDGKPQHLSVTQDITEFVKTQAELRREHNHAQQYFDIAGTMLIALDTDGFIAADIESQTRQSLTNIKNILEAAGSGMDKVIKTTVFLYDMNDFAKMNEVYASFFTAPYPARSAIQAARLPKDARIEIEAIAVFPKLL